MKAYTKLENVKLFIYEQVKNYTFLKTVLFQHNIIPILYYTHILILDYPNN